MVSLATVVQRFFSTYKRTDGLPFQGHIFSATEGDFSATLWSYEALLLHVSPDSPIRARDEIYDTFWRRFLVCEHGGSQLQDKLLYRSYRLVQLTHEMTWSRVTTRLDPLTQEARGDSKELLGKIWVSKEPDGGRADGRIMIHDDAFRIITGHDVKLNDRLDGMQVRRVDDVIGVKLIELR